jgi:hypothetical protein
MSNLEPEEDEGEITQREAVDVMGRLRYFLGQGMAFITDAPNAEIAAWQFSFAIGSDNCIGHTMTSKAKDLNVTTACISKGATRVCRMLEIPPSPYMLPRAAQESYRKLRREQEDQRAKHHAK